MILIKKSLIQTLIRLRILVIISILDVHCRPFLLVMCVIKLIEFLLNKIQYRVFLIFDHGIVQQNLVHWTNLMIVVLHRPVPFDRWYRNDLNRIKYRSVLGQIQVAVKDRKFFSTPITSNVNFQII